MTKQIGKNVKIFIGGQDLSGSGSWNFHSPSPERIKDVEWVDLVDFREVPFYGIAEFDKVDMRNFLHSAHNMAALEGFPRIS